MTDTTQKMTIHQQADAVSWLATRSGGKVVNKERISQAPDGFSQWKVLAWLEGTQEWVVWTAAPTTGWIGDGFYTDHLKVADAIYRDR